MENIRLKVLAGFKAGKSASHLSKIYTLSLDQVLEWKRLTIYGHTDWVVTNVSHKLQPFIRCWYLVLSNSFFQTSHIMNSTYWKWHGDFVVFPLLPDSDYVD